MSYKYIVVRTPINIKHITLPCHLKWPSDYTLPVGVYRVRIGRNPINSAFGSFIFFENDSLPEGEFGAGLGIVPQFIKQGRIKTHEDLGKMMRFSLPMLLSVWYLSRRAAARMMSFMGFA